jgi:hypothetical protein
MRGIVKMLERCWGNSKKQPLKKLVDVSYTMTAEGILSYINKGAAQTTRTQYDGITNTQNENEKTQLSIVKQKASCSGARKFLMYSTCFYGEK